MARMPPTAASAADNVVSSGTPCAIAALRISAPSVMALGPYGVLTIRSTVRSRIRSATCGEPSLTLLTRSTGVPECWMISAVPVVASNLGVMSALVRHGQTGLHFRAGDADDLVAQLRWARGNPARVQEMRPRARAEFEMNYTAERNHEMLMDIYKRAVQRVER